MRHIPEMQAIKTLQLFNFLYINSTMTYLDNLLYITNIVIVIKILILMVSTLNIYEVYKKVIAERDEDAALEAVAMMQQARVIEVTSSIAMQAAKFSYIFKIPLADSIIYITTIENKADKYFHLTY